MNHYMDFDPYLIRESNEQMREEVNSLRLGERLHKNRNPRGSRLAALIEWCWLGSLVKRARWGGTTAMVLAVVVALAALALVAPSSQAAGKPDLVVTSANLTSRNYVFSGVESLVSFTDTTKNRSSATAGISKNALWLQPGNLAVAVRTVPKLKSGESDWGRGSNRITFGKARIGAYHPIVCADARRLIAESNEDNNCRGTGEWLSVIPRRWTGSVTGSGPVVDGVTETWTASAMTFKFSRFEEPGFIHYTAYGDVSYSVSGTDLGGCTWSGSGTATLVNHGDLILPNSFNWYDGFDQIEPFYNITRSCPNGGGTATLTGPFNSIWFDTGDPSPDIANPVGVTSLKGKYDFVSTAGDTIHYDWNLAAN